MDYLPYSQEVLQTLVYIGALQSVREVVPLSQWTAPDGHFLDPEKWLPTIKQWIAERIPPQPQVTWAQFVEWQIQLKDLMLEWHQQENEE